MSELRQPTPCEGFANEADRKKRLGQYFTGVTLARLLATLAESRKAQSILDPMVGSGDMLAGCLAQGANPALLVGIEIDPRAALACEDRLDAKVLGRDAFDPDTLDMLPTRSWDLVITNPPYVRYQSSARAVGGSMRLPSALHIRQGLMACIATAEALDAEDREVFQALAAGYSGLADLAVPSWLLCASLVRPGGTLAMVVPEAWLSRDYAAPVKYLLGREFTVDYIVEDADAVWFSDALVKTTLVVARRVPLRPTAFNPKTEDGFLHVDLAGEAMDERSVVGALFPRAADPDAAFAKRARAALRSRDHVEDGPFRAQWVSAADTSQELFHNGGRPRRWLSELEPGAGAARRNQVGGSVTAPRAVRSAIHAEETKVVTLEDYGWAVGQGLRTGGNDFFYVRAERRAARPGRVVVKVSDTFGGGRVEVDEAALLPVVRRQADVAESFSIHPGELSGRVLVLNGFIHPDDLNAAVKHGYRPVVSAWYQKMGSQLARHVSGAARMPAGVSAAGTKLLPELSAIITNVRSYDHRRPDVPPRYWYQLPAVAPRHRPLVFVARVNGGHPRAVLNPEGRAIVDANFSTMWPTKDRAIDGYAVLAMLHSAWTAASLELIGTVLGGGALKLEATQLRRLALPKLDKRTTDRLSALGKTLASATPDQAANCLAAIDDLIASHLTKSTPTAVVTESLRQIATARLQARTR